MAGRCTHGPRSVRHSLGPRLPAAEPWPGATGLRQPSRPWRLSKAARQTRAPPSRPPPPGPGRSLASPPAPLHLQSLAWCVCSGRAKGPLLGAAPPGGSPATGSVDRPLLRLGAAAPPGVTRIADHSCPGLLVKRGQHHATSDRASFAQCASFRSEST